MSDPWISTTLTSEPEVIQALTELRGKRWLSRGQAHPYGSLIPSIDRGGREHLRRAEKLTLERQSIDTFRSTARFFADEGERNALHSDIGTLIVLRHYGVPTRLLDWSQSPFVAAYFAVSDNDTSDGEIWSFDHDQYLKKGGEQWMRWPRTTVDGSGEGAKFDVNLTAFTVDEPDDWFVCQFYNMGFPRQKAQSGLFTFTARFGRDHADSIANLLVENSYYHLYIVPAAFKPALRRTLRERHGIWRGSMFPDSAGAAETAYEVFK
jgi:FRG domain-containing protein